MSEKEEKNKTKEDKEKKGAAKDFLNGRKNFNPNQQKDPYRRWLIIMGAGLVVYFIYCLWSFYNAPKTPQISYDQLWKLVGEGKVASAIVGDQQANATLTVDYQGKGKAVAAVIPNGGDYPVTNRLEKAGVKVSSTKNSEGKPSLTALLWLIPIFFLVWFFFRRWGNLQSKFGQTGKAHLKKDLPKVKFNDVAGCDEARIELEEIVDFLKNPGKFRRLGARIPKGVLLMGPPGTGKTLLARAIAGEAGVPFFSLSGSDFMEMFVGVGAARVRDLFGTALKNAPCIIFIDEIDAVGRHRGTGLGGGHDEREQTLNQLFVEMDGFDSRDGVIIIAATNRPDTLDPAFLRPGRFDRKVEVGRPDLEGRKGIFKVHLRHLEEDAQNKDVHNMDEAGICELAKRLPGASGADIENIVNEGALLAARKDKEKVEFEDFEKSIEKVVLGAENRSKVISEKEKEISAVHESGHALIAELLPDAPKVKKVSIIPRSGGKGGVTWQVPDEDKGIYSQRDCEDQLAMFVAGRVAEHLMFDGLKSTGAAGDIKEATEIARKMVRVFGMSDKLGMVAWGNIREHPFLGMEMGDRKEESEETSRFIDDEIRHYIQSAYDEVKRRLEKHIKALKAIAAALKEKETLDGEEVRKIIEDNPPN
jgi:cell division protease FtsH